MKYLVYTKDGCPSCENAVKLLVSKGLQFETAQASVGCYGMTLKGYISSVWKCDVKTVPQIFTLDDAGDILCYIEGGYEGLKEHLSYRGQINWLNYIDFSKVTYRLNKA